ncbi:S9 family peptidase [Alloacidobacterium dinghuense]|uniref:Acyl-peptide hydrolase n=1 Tax=Alloacidobacterium dinghuense TaxID=2763107 RepID=A0A7G8BHI3_9BACT|nr:S9 family peptidase [Alloacidobacterium dinghuense]QNI32003.1 S9 family peptidase [Alloacidobacterium dinghuense]
MEKCRPLQLLLVFACGVCVPLAASSGPDDRQITDPKSVVSPSNPAAHPASIDDLYYTRSMSGAAWSPDGKEIAFTSNMAGRPNLWKVNAKGGWPIQLTQSDDRQYSAVWSPDGKWIVYQQDRGGDELWDLYAIPSEGGEVINLTNTPDIREEGPVWSHDGKTIAFGYKPKEGSQYDIALLDWITHKVHKLTNEQQPGYSWNAVAWSPDDKTIYANRVNPPFTDADIYSIDVSTGKTENLTPHQGTVRYLASSLAPNGQTVLLTSDAKGGYMNVALLDIASRKSTWVTDSKWEASSGSFSPDGKRFSYVINGDGLTDAYIADTSSNQAEKIDLAQGLNSFSGNPNEFAPQSDRVIVSHEASNQPGDLWVYDLAKRHEEQLTFSAVASLSATPLPPAQIVHYKTYDGKTISALLWMPFNLKRDESNPALVLPHGGPTGQVVDYWSPRVAALTSRGYICIAPNPRGSTGYGLDFQKANFQDLGGGDLKDEIAAVDFLKTTGYVDPKKVGITGGSYGGFMTLMAIGKAPDIWGAAVEEYGIINWSTMLKSSDPSLNEYLKAVLGDPDKNRKVYEEDSPITYIRNEKAPLLVLQGGNDPRVPKEEAQQVVEILRKEGRVVDVHYYPNEGHGFEKRENQIDAIKRTIAWFDQYLMGKSGTPNDPTAQKGR